jgi:hypothetical protein
MQKLTGRHLPKSGAAIIENLENVWKVLVWAKGVAKVEVIGKRIPGYEVI